MALARDHFWLREWRALFLVDAPAVALRETLTKHSFVGPWIYKSEKRETRTRELIEIAHVFRQVLIKHLKTKPAALVPAGAIVKSGGNAEGSKSSKAEGGAASVNSNIPPKLLVVRATALPRALA
jgi:hypothetical protein